MLWSMTNPLQAAAPRASAEQESLQKARTSLIIRPSGALGTDRCETRRASARGLLNTVQLTLTAAALGEEEHWRCLPVPDSSPMAPAGEELETTPISLRV